MQFSFSFNFFVGSALILWGVSIFIKLIWGIDLPLFKAFMALFLIYLGISILVESKSRIFYSRKTARYYFNDDRD